MAVLCDRLIEKTRENTIFVHFCPVFSSVGTNLKILFQTHGEFDFTEFELLIEIEEPKSGQIGELCQKVKRM